MFNSPPFRKMSRVFPNPATVPLSPDADDVEVGDPADLQLEAQLRHAARVRDLAA